MIEHPDWVKRAVQAQLTDREAYAQPITEDMRRSVRGRLWEGALPFRLLALYCGTPHKYGPIDRRQTRRVLTQLQSRGEVVSVVVQRFKRPQAIRRYVAGHSYAPGERPPVDYWHLEKRRPMRIYVLTDNGRAAQETTA